MDNLQTLEELYAVFPLAAGIQSAEDLETASELLGALGMLGGNRNKAQATFFIALNALVRAYEEANEDHRWYEDITPLEVLEYLLEENNLSPTDLGRILGDVSTGHKVLKGERELSKAHIITLCQRFKLRPDAFLRVPEESASGTDT